jgi:hypothetical protein
MNELDWLQSQDPAAMLRLVSRPSSAGAAPLMSERKFRLLACACCREIWTVLDERRREIVETAECYADGTLAQFKAAGHINQGIRREEEFRGGLRADYVSWALSRDGRPSSGGRFLWPDAEAGTAIGAVRRSMAAKFIREIAGNPFRRVQLPLVRSEIRAIAETACEERILPSGHLDAVRLAVLADALEESGCTDADLLGHLRSPGLHVRGCWALDLILNRARLETPTPLPLQ